MSQIISDHLATQARDAAIRLAMLAFSSTWKAAGTVGTGTVNFMRAISLRSVVPRLASSVSTTSHAPASSTVSLPWTHNDPIMASAEPSLPSLKLTAPDPPPQPPAGSVAQRAKRAAVNAAYAAGRARNRRNKTSKAVIGSLAAVVAIAGGVTTVALATHAPMLGQALKPVVPPSPVMPARNYDVINHNGIGVEPDNNGGLIAE